ncbi:MULTISPECIES: hypothetical protein [Actinomycetes]
MQGKSGKLPPGRPIGMLAALREADSRSDADEYADDYRQCNRQTDE